MTYRTWERQAVRRPIYHSRHHAVFKRRHMVGGSVGSVLRGFYKTHLQPALKRLGKYGMDLWKHHGKHLKKVGFDLLSTAGKSLIENALNSVGDTDMFIDNLIKDPKKTLSETAKKIKDGSLDIAKSTLTQGKDALISTGRAVKDQIKSDATSLLKDLSKEAQTELAKLIEEPKTGSGVRRGRKKGSGMRPLGSGVAQLTITPQQVMNVAQKERRVLRGGGVQLL